jgi:3-dehydroquinate synthase II
MINRKQVMIRVERLDDDAKAILKRALEKGFHSLLFEETPAEWRGMDGFTTYTPKGDGDVQVVSPDEIEGVEEGRPFAVHLSLLEKGDEEKAIEASRLGAEAVLVETGDWKIIPLENLVAELHREKTRIFAYVEDIGEVETMLGVLELGVDGVVFSPGNAEDIDEVAKVLEADARIHLVPAKVVEKREVGMGDRVCIDTASLIGMDEGMLVGSQANLLFLISGEIIGSKFSAPRPFRVNAGPVHSYVLLPNGKTKYLSELECGDPVLLVDLSGISRKAIVGRVKIERRPLSIVKVRCGETVGKILVQNAETIRFVTEDGGIVSVTDLEPGMEILVHVKAVGGRHFGTEVEEFILER